MRSFLLFPILSSHLPRSRIPFPFSSLLALSSHIITLRPSTFAPTGLPAAAATLSTRPHPIYLPPREHTQLSISLCFSFSFALYIDDFGREEKLVHASEKKSRRERERERKKERLRYTTQREGLGKTSEAKRNETPYTHARETEFTTGRWKRVVEQSSERWISWFRLFERKTEKEGGEVSPGVKRGREERGGRKDWTNLATPAYGS